MTADTTNTGNTVKPLITSTFQRQLAGQIGISYKSFMYHLNTTSPVYSPVLEQDVTILAAGVTPTKPVPVSYVSTEPISGVDLSTLGPGITALHPDKEQVYATYVSASEAA
jgi:hypothetical protein